MGVNPYTKCNECAKLGIDFHAVQTEMTGQWHYVYYSYEQWGRGYIGRRSSKVHPSLDPYMGSFRDKTFAPTEKIILAEFDSVEEAVQAEIKLHSFFAVDSNPHFANQAKQTSTSFSCARGRPGARTRDECQAISDRARAAWQDPKQRQKWLTALRRRSTSETWKQSHLRSKQSPAYRAKMSLLVKQRWENEDFQCEQTARIREMSLSEHWQERHLEGCKKNKKYLYTLTSPDGEIIQVDSLRLFCMEHGLSQENIRQVAIGQKKTHRGWKAARQAL
jgi:hypothetical protein